jgi:hypothetical protein
VRRVREFDLVSADENVSHDCEVIELALKHLTEASWVIKGVKKLFWADKQHWSALASDDLGTDTMGESRRADQHTSRLWWRSLKPGVQPVDLSYLERP